MGNSQTNSLLALYGTSTHPIHGQVIVYYIKGQAGKFIMKTKSKISKQQYQLFQLIGKNKNQKLVIFYGCNKDNILNNINILHNDRDISNNSYGDGDGDIDVHGRQINKQNKQKLQKQKKLQKSKQIQIQKQKLQKSKQLQKQKKDKQKYQQKFQKQLDLYWQYYNWDLCKQIQHTRIKNQSISQQTLWQILDICLQASQYLQTYNIYPQIRPKKIQFTSGKQPKLFWDDILPNNLHRSYIRYINTGQFRHTIYSPQQLLQINRIQRLQIHLQKCVIFSLGLTLLEAIIKMDIKSIYNYRNRLMSQVKKRDLLAMAKNKCSKQLYRILEGLLEYFPKDRYGYHDLQIILDRHYGRNMHEVIQIQLSVNGDTDRKTESKRGGGGDQQKSQRTEITDKFKTVQEMALKRPKSKSVITKFQHLC